MRVLGLMSGTSVDAVDAALCHLAPDPDSPETGLTLSLLEYTESAFPSHLRTQVLELLASSRAPLDVLTELNFTLGDAFADAVLGVAQKWGIRFADIDLIASAGQTIYHLVDPERRRATLQMAEPAVVARRTGVTVVADFRVADVAAGGHGAPLVSYFDALFFRSPDRVRAVQNIGGIGNVTFVFDDPARAYAFDTGPGNALIDYGARYFSRGAEGYDCDGRMASLGAIYQPLVEEVLSQPYFSQPPPKTTGRELFGDAFAAHLVERAVQLGLTPENTLATLTAITAGSIARAYREFGPEGVDELVLAGGGAKNQYLVALLRALLPNVRIIDHDTFGIPPGAREAVAFALLGYQAMHGRRTTLPRCTGASTASPLGKIVPGDNYVPLMEGIFYGRGQGAKWADTQTLRLIDSIRNG
ncbi:MAG: anhydro-N-acetylmuramic acid kinase [Chloroflexota bacterium]|nr:MAG: anhydro-N-acetylmuramic acid kinase [Chloroflexota bacterium]